MNARLLIPLLFATIVLVGLFVRKINLGLRIAFCLVFSFVCSLLALTGSLAPHRIAEGKMANLGQTPSDEWIKGALATRDAVQVMVIFWLLPLIVLSVLCIYLYCQKAKKSLPE